MDTSVALVQAYLHVNGYFTVAEYPVLEAFRGEHARSGCPPDRPDMIVGEVKEGAARLNAAMRDPIVPEPVPQLKRERVRRRILRGQDANPRRTV